MLSWFLSDSLPARAKGNLLGRVRLGGHGGRLGLNSLLRDVYAAEVRVGAALEAGGSARLLTITGLSGLLLVSSEAHWCSTFLSVVSLVVGLDLDDLVHDDRLLVGTHVIKAVA